MKGLIIKPKWAELILSGEKTMEIRGSKTNIRGCIGIIESGSKTIFGTADLYHCTELTKELFDVYKSRHKLDISYEELLKVYPKPYGWRLRNIERFPYPIPYKHKQGCVIWVNI